MKVICISGKAGHGKDTLAGCLKDILEDRGDSVLIAHFADLVKYVCKTFFGWNGEKDEAGRTLLQYVGTDRVRSQSPDYWADFLVNILSIFHEEWDYVIIPDTRFPNEYEIFKHYGFDVSLVRVNRPDYVSGLTPEQLSHPSETALDNYIPDYFVSNTTMDDLRSAAKTLLDDLDRGRR